MAFFSHENSRLFLPTLVGLSVLMVIPTLMYLTSTYPSIIEHFEDGPGSVSDVFRSYPFIVHYVLFHKNDHSLPTPLLFADCLSILSVLKHLGPDHIYVHTNIPEFWPFQVCNSSLGQQANWSSITVVKTDRTHELNGRKITFIEHEADIKKLSILQEYGGLVIDFDVYMIKGFKLRELLTQHACVACPENRQRMNAGFLACRKGAVYPRMVWEESYLADYQADVWIYNSGLLPWHLYLKHPETAYLAYGVCNGPDPPLRKEFLEENRRHNWTDKMAHHSYNSRNKTFWVEERLNSSDSSMADLLKWVLYSAPTVHS